MPEAKLRVGVLASGRGSNLQAIIDAIETGKLAARIAVVISNKKDTQALERARRHGVADVFLDPAPYKDRPESRKAYDQAVLEVLRKHDVELIVLAGYMKIVTRVLIDAYPNRIMNVHPSLLPSFPGLKAQQQAFDWGVKVSGCTVHFVTEGVDTGPIIRQAAVLVQENDTMETLEARILVEEHRIYPEAIQLFADGRLSVEGRRVHIR
ncbi:MAG TPA: phosphoribosylglycinamide formyltransferase [Nitrospirales bacterium]|nr:phosphoribosylglycinamide formyltransferase [Nitrospirales bacterium]